MSAAPPATRRGKRKAAPRPDDRPPVAGLAARQCAARLLAAVVDSHTSLDGLTDQQHGHPQYLALDLRDRALVRAILAAALRFHLTSAALIAARLERPLPQNARALEHVLHVAAAQMLFLDIPDSAAVDVAVTQAGADPRTRRFAPLVNAVLREIGRRKERALPAALAATRDCPDWLAERIERDYGAERTAAILTAHRMEAPTDFTVKSDPERWAEALGGIVLPTGTVRVARPAAPIPDLPGFDEGEWWVQDAAASLPARLFGDLVGRRVADLCAAPGGKTAQLAAAGAAVTAVEQSPNRAGRLRANLERLGLAAEIHVADLFAWQPNRHFDAVLLDAPCSSTGTVRRHPDVPWTKSAQDIAKLAALQKNMVRRALDFLAPGGLLVFSNCSLDHEEGETLVAALLAEGLAAEPVPLVADELPFAAPWLTAGGYLRTTPADLPHADPRLAGMDGFFAARLRKA